MRSNYKVCLSILLTVQTLWIFCLCTPDYKVRNQMATFAVQNFIRYFKLPRIYERKYLKLLFYNTMNEVA